MILVEDVITIHQILISRFGGAAGIRDRGALESALARPYSTFAGTDLYPDEVDKAAALFESLLNNHPFVDGNKRVAYVVTRIFLLDHNIDLHASQEEKYDFVIASAEGRFQLKDINEWLRKHIA